jgi:hypothetical protein
VGGGGRTLGFTPVATIYLPLVSHIPYTLEYPGMRGVAGNPEHRTHVFEEVTWFNWNPSESYFAPSIARMIFCASDRQDSKLEVPWYGTTNYSNPITMTAQADYGSYRGRVWLFLNEPDDFYSDVISDAQCGWYTATVRSTNEITQIRTMSGAQEMAHRYLETREMIRKFDPSAKVYPAGIMQPLIGSWVPTNCKGLVPCGGKPWWRTFIHEISTTLGVTWRTKIDGIHLHAYPKTIGHTACDFDLANDEWCVDKLKDALESYYTDILSDEMGLQDKPIWVAETGATPACDAISTTYGIWSTQAYTDVAENIADPMIAWMTGGDNPGYDKLFWYVPWTKHDKGKSWCTFLYTNTTWAPPTYEVSSTLNALGEAWADGDW